MGLFDPMTDEECRAMAERHESATDKVAERRVFGSWVYYAQRGRGGPIKIGTSNSPYSRVREMRTACPEGLFILAIERGSRGVERDRHEAWAHLRIAGEWFHPSPGLLHWIDSIGLDAWREGPLK